MEKELLEKIIKNQDKVVYFMVNSIAEMVRIDSETGNSYMDLSEMITQDEDALSKLSTNNLALVFSSLLGDSKAKTKIEEMLMAKVKAGENIFSGINAEYDHMGFFYSTTWSDMLSNFSEENQSSILKAIEERFNNFKTENEAMYNIADYLQDYLNISNFFSCYDRGIFSEKAVAVMKKIIDKDLNIFNAMNFNMMQDEFLNLNEDSLMHILRYPNLSSKLLLIKDNAPELLDAFINEVNSIQGNEHISTVYEEIERMASCFAQNYSSLNGRSSQEAIDLSLKNFKLREKYLENGKQGQSIEEFLDEEFQKTIQNESKIEEKYSSFTQESLRRDKYEIIFNKYFSISLEDAERIVKEYGEDFSSIEEGLDDVSKETLGKIKAILSLENLEELNQLFAGKHLSITTEIVPAKSMIAIESSYREAYAKTYTKSFNSTANKISEEIQNGNVSFVEADGKQVLVVKLTTPFNFLIHSSDTGFKGDKELTNNSFKETWTNTEDTSHHLVATANIDESFMGMAPIGKNGVYYGFVPNNPQNINLMGNHDIDSHVRISKYAAHDPKYISQEKMPYSSRRVYSEFAIEKAIPDYVIIFDDMDETKLENAYKAASEFGIPVVSINKREVVKNQEENLENLMDEYRKSHSLVDLEKIIKTFETNKAGWLLNRVDEKDETFTESIQHTEFAETFNNLGIKIREILSEFQKNASIEDLKSLRSVLESEAKLYKSQNELNVPFTKVKMSDFLTITLEETIELVKNNDITQEDVAKETHRLIAAEKGIEPEQTEVEEK